jgi:DNA-binding LacI/PurR family transcriptional regulator/DNA-binding transcriptional regulator YhcF (GntR family)
MPEEIAKLPLYEQLYRFVLGEIHAGRLAPGARVPSEKDLADKFHVSRITSKRALEKLVLDGLIQRARGRGSFVALGAKATDQDLRSVDAPQQIVAQGTPPPLVGLLIPESTDVFGSHLVRTIESQLRRQQIRILLCRTEGRRELEEAAIDDCLALGVKGLIVCPVHGEYYNERLLRLVLDHFPIVLVDRYLRGIPVCSVCTDNRSAAKELTNHLISQGHRHFAFITVPPAGTSSIEDRLLGMKDAIDEHGLQFNVEEDTVHVYSTLPGAMMHRSQDIARDVEAIHAYAERHPQVTVYIACEFPMVLLARQVMDEMGRAAPADYVLACFDAPPSPFGTSPITYIEQDEEQMGCDAVELLLTQIQRLDVPLHVATGYRLIHGHST